MKIYLLILSLFSFLFTYSQSSFQYEVELESIQIPSLPGIHSYAFAQDDDKILIIGGRLDGLHARQPFNAFPANSNNTDIYVVDVESKHFWSMSLTGLSSSLQEQLQSTNMNFFQDDSVLYIIGGYAYSATAADHITFNKLTSVDVPGLIDAVVNATSIVPYFKQISDDKFAVTGGQLGKIGNTFYLVGGHRFDGRYNPMGHSTYVQSYTNQIRKFNIDNSGTQLSFSNYTAVTDVQHLHRRDYNLIPQIFPDGSEGYTISSGVFQANVDLPFLYPVDIKATTHTANTSFDQYLSNYHCATAALYDSSGNQMHTLFFGGMSQYYYDSGNLITDNNVPFVKTISRLSRTSDGSLFEYKLNKEMPGLLGASAEFIPNLDLPMHGSEIFKLNEFTQDTVEIGYIIGGIKSTALNPFVGNQTSLTSAETTIYKVLLIKSEYAGVLDQKISNEDPYKLKLAPNPVDQFVDIQFNLKNSKEVMCYVSDVKGQLLLKKNFGVLKEGYNQERLDLADIAGNQSLFITLKFGKTYSTVRRIIKE